MLPDVLSCCEKSFMAAEVYSSTITAEGFRVLYAAKRSSQLSQLGVVALPVHVLCLW
jgi:hypothetical protein